MINDYSSICEPCQLHWIHWFTLLQNRGWGTREALLVELLSLFSVAAAPVAFSSWNYSTFMKLRYKTMLNHHTMNLGINVTRNWMGINPNMFLQLCWVEHESTFHSACQDMSGPCRSYKFPLLKFF